jgi:hypothetical protein
MRRIVTATSTAAMSLIDAAIRRTRSGIDSAYAGESTYLTITCSGGVEPHRGNRINVHRPRDQKVGLAPCAGDLALQRSLPRSQASAALSQGPTTRYAPRVPGRDELVDPGSTPTPSTRHRAGANARATFSFPTFSGMAAPLFTAGHGLTMRVGRCQSIRKLGVWPWIELSANSWLMSSREAT